MHSILAYSSDCDYVMDIWRDLIGDYESKVDNCCGWNGVVCNSKQEIIQIQWSSKGLQGMIHRGFSKLIHLKELDLCLNEMDGPLFIRNLPISLESL